MKRDIETLRGDFPSLQQTNRGKPLVYLDSAASAQKPIQVVDAMSHFYLHDYANIHRGLYELAERSTKLYESTRETVRSFINAPLANEIVYVRGTTEGINLVAQSFVKHHLKAGDEILVSELEHHSNIVPWYLLCKEKDLILKVIPVTDLGEIDLDAYRQLFTNRTKFVAVSHASNALGTINPVIEMTQIAHEHDAKILVDGAQAVPHMPVDVTAINCDFYVFSAHKIYGPTGIGVLYGKAELLAQMPPYQGGGDMIEKVSFEHITFAKPPQQFEAGTPDIGGVVGMRAAIHYLQDVGMEAIFAHEQVLLRYANDALAEIPNLRIVGNVPLKVGVISFVIKGIHPHDISTILDSEGIAIRAGNHCAMPLMARLNIPATARASFGVYNNKDDIHALVHGIHVATRLFS